MLALIAQVIDPDLDPSGVLGQYWPLAALLIPGLVAIATRCHAESWVKRGVASVFAVAAVAVSLIGMHWDNVTLALIVQRLTTEAVIAEVTYRAAEFLVQAATSSPFASLSVFMPNKGIDAGTNAAVPGPACGPTDPDY